MAESDLGELSRDAMLAEIRRLENDVSEAQFKLDEWSRVGRSVDTDLLMRLVQTRAWHAAFFKRFDELSAEFGEAPPEMPTQADLLARRVAKLTPIAARKDAEATAAEAAADKARADGDPDAREKREAADKAREESDRVAAELARAEAAAGPQEREAR